jgi:hypothetical protein
MNDDDFAQVINTIDNENDDWVHMVPPCRTLTKARRTGRQGSAKQLRAPQNPEGVPNKTETAGRQTVGSQNGSHRPTAMEKR